MYFPVRCFTCGAVIGDLYEDYAKKVKEGKDPAKVLNDLEVQRYCCRRMFLGQVEAVEKLAKYEKL